MVAPPPLPALSAPLRVDEPSETWTSQALGSATMSVAMADDTEPAAKPPEKSALRSMVSAPSVSRAEVGDIPETTML